MFGRLHQWQLVHAFNDMKFVMPTAKTSIRDILPTYQDKFGHVD